MASAGRPRRRVYCTGCRRPPRRSCDRRPLEPTSRVTSDSPLDPIRRLVAASPVVAADLPRAALPDDNTPPARRSEGPRTHELRPESRRCHRRRHRHRQGRRHRAAQGRLSRRPRRSPPRAAGTGDRRSGGPAGRRAGRPHRRQRSRVGPRAVRAVRESLRPPRRPFQQRRRRRTRRQPRGAHVRAVEERRRHQPDRRLPVHAGSDPDDEGADAARRPDHQQRIDLRARAAPEFGALYRDEARDHRTHEVDVARRPQVRHRVRADRHRQRRDGPGGADGEGRSAGQRRKSPSSR